MVTAIHDPEPWFAYGHVMARRRVLVAIVPPPEIRSGCRVLRRMLGDNRPERIVPHITLVPPVNLEPGRFASVRRHVRAIATEWRPITLNVEGVASFLPSTPTVHLSIGDLSEGQLLALRTALMVDDLFREDLRPFRPHITLREKMNESQIDRVLETFESASFEWANSGEWEVTSIRLMEQFRTDQRGTYWATVAEEKLAPATVVGRGGVELVIHSSSVVEPEVASLLGTTPNHLASTKQVLCVTAEIPRKVGQPVGVVLGDLSPDGAKIGELAVRPDSRGMGIARQLISHWCHLAATSGAALTWANDCEGAEVLGATGFSRVGGLWIRELNGS